MKKKINRYKIGLLLLAAVVFLFGQPLTAQNTGMEKQLAKLQQKLNLNEEQTAAVKEILRQEDVQKASDRETYKKDALALIRAAWDRRKNTHDKIEPLLDEAQREEFKSTVKPHPVDRELFELTEGLLLTEEQAFDVEGILIQFHNEYGRMGEMMEEGGGMPIGPSPGGGGRMGMGMPMGGGRGMAGMMKTQEAKKAKAVKKVLDEAQKVMYEQIRKDRKEKMKERIKEMKERFKR